MKLKYDNKEIDIKNCKMFHERLIGNMFKKNITTALLFKHCNSIHTFFMKSNIDVIMCDRNNNILYYYENLKKNTIILPKKNVSFTIELPIKYFKIKTNTKIVLE